MFDMKPEYYKKLIEYVEKYGTDELVYVAAFVRNYLTLRRTIDNIIEDDSISLPTHDLLNEFGMPLIKQINYFLRRHFKECSNENVLDEYMKNIMFFESIGISAITLAHGNSSDFILPKTYYQGRDYVEKVFASNDGENITYYENRTGSMIPIRYKVRFHKPDWIIDCTVTRDGKYNKAHLITKSLLVDTSTFPKEELRDMSEPISFTLALANNKIVKK